MLSYLYQNQNSVLPPGNTFIRNLPVMMQQLSTIYNVLQNRFFMEHYWCKWEKDQGCPFMASK